MYRLARLTPILFLLILALPAGASVLPGLLSGIPVYPNARVVIMQDAVPTAFVTMETAAPTEAILDYYKEKLAQDGWEMSLEIVTPKGASASFLRAANEEFLLSIEPGTGHLNLITTTITRKDGQ